MSVLFCSALLFHRKKLITGVGKELFHSVRERLTCTFDSPEPRHRREVAAALAFLKYAAAQNEHREPNT